VNEIFELTRDNIIGEHVGNDEELLDKTEKFNRGTVLTIVRHAHPWGHVKELEYCTVQIGGKYFNIAALVLAKSIKPMRP
jgi:hypothetical protein